MTVVMHSELHTSRHAQVAHACLSDVCNSDGMMAVVFGHSLCTRFVPWQSYPLRRGVVPRSNDGGRWGARGLTTQLDATTSAVTSVALSVERDTAGTFDRVPVGRVGSAHGLTQRFLLSPYPECRTRLCVRHSTTHPVTATDPSGLASLSVPAVGNASIAPMSGVQMYFSKEGRMATHARLASIAVDETLDVQVATEEALRSIREALADGNVTPQEARRILDKLERAHTEAKEALRAVENTEIGERIALSGLTGVVPPYLIRQAAERGLGVIVVHPAMSEPVELHQGAGDAA